MSQGNIKVIDAVSKKVVPLPVTPGTSLLATTPSQFLSELNIDRLYMSACEMPEVIVPNHLLTLQLSPQHLFETWEEGQLKQIYKGVRSVTLAPSEFRFRGRWNRDVEILVLTLKPAAIANCAIKLHDVNQTELVRCTGRLDSQIWHLGLALEAELKEGNPNGRYFWESLTNAIAVRVLKQYSAFDLKVQHYSGSLSPHQLRHTIEYINDNLSTQLSLNVLAAMLGMSPYYFERLFKQSVGQTPHQYILQCRIERAKQLLRTTQLPIMEIAFQVGCENHSHFSKLFRKLTGMSPRTYRNQLADSGRIVTFSTPYTVQPQPNLSVIAGSKAAIEAFTFALAKEVGSRGIRVNAIMPGPTTTDSFTSMVSSEEQAQLLQMAPLQRLAEPEDIANAVAFLVSDDSGYITGHTLHATGGLA